MNITDSWGSIPTLWIYTRLYWFIKGIRRYQRSRSLSLKIYKITSNKDKNRTHKTTLKTKAGVTRTLTKKLVDFIHIRLAFQLQFSTKILSFSFYVNGHLSKRTHTYFYDIDKTKSVSQKIDKIYYNFLAKIILKHHINC